MKKKYWKIHIKKIRGQFNCEVKDIVIIAVKYQNSEIK